MTVLPPALIGSRVAKIKDNITVLKARLLKLQEECAHDDHSVKYREEAEYLGCGEDKRWYDCYCHNCGKGWREDVKREDMKKDSAAQIGLDAGASNIETPAPVEVNADDESDSLSAMVADLIAKVKRESPSVGRLKVTGHCGTTVDIKIRTKTPKPKKMGGQP